jgi:hypothetical protein
MTSDEAINEQQGGGCGNELGCPESVRPTAKEQETISIHIRRGGCIPVPQ